MAKSCGCGPDVYCDECLDEKPKVSAQGEGVGSTGGWVPSPYGLSRLLAALTPQGDPLRTVLLAEARRNRPAETTALSPAQEQAFRAWAKAAGIADVDSPHTFYDYRGYWRDIASRGGDQRKSYADGLHFPDTYKQHGHPTFSNESRYAWGRGDAGRWGGPDGETFFAPQRGDSLATLAELLRRNAKRP